ncbi:hypothetical protein [Filimonas effusa]|uniref:Uncharacterized protein n=1 Tax=Filimonas effusa TaxID=2508721 RepID=A0A4Q1D3P7_9BACT|nr:hypothetical protein [Filimonas effusa]RXK82948.1 hypothetical protein ESB13_12530 [Filimonas effusa]
MNLESIPGTFTIPYRQTKVKVETKCSTYKCFVVHLPDADHEIFMSKDNLGSSHWNEAFKGETALARELGKLIEAC